uniref:Uncharacterized protein n=1 Tax=Pseudomonas phage HRDY3 TaxID=3236930 RepID=A0AB39CDJ8_9VIRU
MELQLALAAVRLSVARPFVKGWNKNGVGVKLIRRFLPKGSKGYRLYMPINKTSEDKVVVPAAVFHAVQSAGYKVEDYINGIAVTPDGKRRIRIGKILRDAEAIKEFSHDPQRSAHKDEYTCVISCHPYDVIGMSTGRRWDFTTCMRLATPENEGKHGERAHFMAGTVAEGTLVAYVISPKDTNINKPHARLLIKPFKKDDDENHVYFKVETHVYGQPIPGFRRTVDQWLKKVNQGAAHGIYKLSDEVHIDGGNRLHLLVDYDKAEDKETFVRKNLYKVGGLENWFENDLRWFSVMVKALDDPYQLTDALKGVYLNNFMNANEVGAAYDEAIGDDPEAKSYDVVDHLIGTDAQILIDTSKKLHDAYHELHAYEKFETNYEHALNLGRYDSRWLGNVTSIDGQGLARAGKLFLAGQLQWTPELQESELEGARHLRQYFAFLAHTMLSLKPDDADDKADRANLKIFVRSAHIPAGWDEEIYDILGTVNWSETIRRFTKPHVNPYSAALDSAPDWAAVNPQWLQDASELKPATFDKLAQMATHNQKVLGELLQWVAHRNSGALNDGINWLRQRHNIQDFLDSLVDHKNEKISDLAKRINAHKS